VTLSKTFFIKKKISAGQRISR